MELNPHEVTGSLNQIFSVEDDTGIRAVYENSVGFEYSERQASLRVQFLTEYFDWVIESDQVGSLDEEFIEEANKLFEYLSQLLGKNK